ncbi:hypothetical protein HAX54_040891, partial [Datura stramonium]|nr:hypothetical protein [Datura stramonium]
NFGILDPGILLDHVHCSGLSTATADPLQRRVTHCGESIAARHTVLQRNLLSQILMGILRLPSQSCPPVYPISSTILA